MNAFEFHCPTRIICGEHALHKLPVILVEMGVTKPLVVTDANLVALGITDHAVHRLTEAGFPFAFYDQVPPDSSLSVVNDVAAIYEQEGCDGFIAFGGGSVIDTTKGAAASISVGNRDIAELQGAEILQNDLDPLIAIPTTAGTGSEVTLVAVIADEEAHEKLSYTSYKLVPHVAFLDPLHRFAATEAHCHDRCRRTHPRDRGLYLHPEEPRFRCAGTPGNRAYHGEPRALLRRAGRP